MRLATLDRSLSLSFLIVSHAGGHFNGEALKSVPARPTRSPKPSSRAAAARSKRPDVPTGLAQGDGRGQAPNAHADDEGGAVSSVPDFGRWPSRNPTRRG